VWSNKGGYGIAGVHGDCTSPSGTGVLGTSYSYYGVNGISDSGTGVFGQSKTGDGVTGITIATQRYAAPAPLTSACMAKVSSMLVYMGLAAAAMVFWVIALLKKVLESEATAKRVLVYMAAAKTTMVFLPEVLWAWPLYLRETLQRLVLFIKVAARIDRSSTRPS